ncbi:DNA polymerase Y family protein [Streptomyces sp. NPDC004647]|uniref:DNA polymerase Y family protein n=1 Tax=Streptomyces sp. NPDC004647 TaxID=3154671 RepID=UPI0033BB1135
MRVPHWPIVASGAAPEEPLAITSAGRIADCSTPARAAGVRRGMRIRQAQSRLEGLRLRERDMQEETRAFEPLVQRIETDITPRLEIIRPGLLALPAKGPARYWGGEHNLAERLTTTAAVIHLDVTVGAADTVFAAALAARRAHLVPEGTTRAFLAPYPLGVLDRPALADLLLRLGITTLGEFADLPTEAVLARFGADALTAHRTARGLEQRGLNAQASSPRHHVATDFDPAEDRLDPVVFAAKTLAAQLHTELRSAGVTCARLELRIHLNSGRALHRLWRHEGKLSDLAVAERVRWQLQAWLDSAALADSAGSGISRLELRPEQLTTAPGEQDALFGSRPAAELGRAAARLQAMLGHRAVTRAELSGGRSPRDRVRRVPFGDVVDSGRPTVGPWIGQLPAPHPAHVFPHPLPARLLDAAQHDIEVSGRAVLSAAPARLGVDGWPTAAVTGWAGPWPLVEDWWQPSSHRRVARLQVTTSDGRAWLLCRVGDWWAEALYG